MRVSGVAQSARVWPQACAGSRTSAPTVPPRGCLLHGCVILFCVLVVCGRCNKLLQIYRITIIQTYSLTVLEIRSLKQFPWVNSRCGQSGSFWRLWGKNVSPCLVPLSERPVLFGCASEVHLSNLCLRHHITFSCDPDSSCVPLRQALVTTSGQPRKSSSISPSQDP